MDREKAIEMLKALDMMLRSPDGKPISDVCDALNMAIEALQDRPKGKWVENVVRWGNAITTVHGYRCSECGALNLCKDKFCPYCGKDMEVGENE